MVGESQIVVWNGSTEEPLTAPRPLRKRVNDWSPDGKELLITQEVGAILIQLRFGCYRPRPCPVGSQPRARLFPTRITFSTSLAFLVMDNGLCMRLFVTYRPNSNPNYSSPAHRAGRGFKLQMASIGMTSPFGLQMGKTIYFLSGPQWFLQRLGIRFDLPRGKITGDVFQVTALDKPGLMIPQHIPAVAFSLAQDKMVLTISQTSGSIWVLDNVGPLESTSCERDAKICPA